MPEALRSLPIDILYLQNINMVGVDALKQLLSNDMLQVPTITPTKQPISLPTLSELVGEISLSQQHGLIMLMGKVV